MTNRRIPGRRIRRRLSTWLRKKHGDQSYVVSLAQKIWKCSPNGRCLSAACPTCGFTAQRKCRKVLARAERETDGDMFVVSLVLSSAAVDANNLKAFDCDVLLSPVRDACEASDMAWAVFAIDVSFNEHRTGRYAPFFMPHLHGVVKTFDPACLRRELKRRFVATETVPRPVHIKRWDGRHRAFSYLLKQRFDRRIGIDDVERFDQRKGAVRLCRAVQHDRPRSAEQRDMLLFLDRLGVEGRLMLAGPEVPSVLKEYFAAVTKREAK